ncbi:MAG TPA: hypothetical protein VKU01_26145 [Bryobacteraceae bacterium]|nr:hypothetical protein [Bryobacteraceae bacterium]
MNLTRNAAIRVEAAKQARRSIGLMRRKLLRPTPEVLEDCVPHLRLAIKSLSDLQTYLRRWEPAGAEEKRALQIEVAELHRELEFTNALMRKAGAFFGGWAKLVFPEESRAYAANGRLRPAGVVTTMRAEG